MDRSAAITGVGHYAPEKVLTNQDLEKMVDTNDEWIRTRTGIRERRILEDGKGSSFMGIKAAEMILDEKNISPEEIDMIQASACYCIPRIDVSRGGLKRFH